MDQTSPLEVELYYGGGGGGGVNSKKGCFRRKIEFSRESDNFAGNWETSKFSAKHN